MFKILLFVTCVAMASGCSKLQRMLVKQQWGQALGVSEDRETLGREIWEDIFEMHPEFREKFFTRVRGDNIFSPEFRAHAARVLSGFDRAISLLANEEVLAADLAHLHSYHAELGVDAQAFDAFRVALMDEIGDRLGHCFEYDAWNSCISEISAGILGITNLPA